MTQVTLHTTDIDEFIEDFIKYSGVKPVMWFLGKYRITYDEYSYLSFAAMPARTNRTAARTIHNKLSRYILTVSKEVTDLQRYILTHECEPELKTICDSLQRATDTAKRKYTEEAMNEFVEELKYE